MSFVSPIFLFALLAVVIPIIIHLFHFKKFQKIYFSNVAFLNEIKLQNSSKEKLKNLLILISRVLAILFLVLAFARPYWSDITANNHLQNNEISIYIDNSFSMGLVDKEGSLFDEAKRKAKSIVKTALPNDRFQLLTNDFEGKHQRFVTADEFLNKLEEVKINATYKTLQQVLNRQESLFNNRSNKVAYLISDFQKTWVGNEKLHLNNSIYHHLIQLKPNYSNNISLDSLWFSSPVHLPQQNEKLIIRLKNYGKSEVRNIPVKILLNNQQKTVASITIKANSTSLDTLSFTNIGAGWQKGLVKITDFPITFDDNLFFSYKINNHKKILIINGLNTNNYIYTLYKTDNFFQASNVNEGNINYSDLANFDLVILNELNQYSSGLAQELKKYTSQSGTLVIFPNTEIDNKLYSSFLTHIGLPAVKELITEPTKIEKIELQNNLFKGVFDELPKNMDYPLVNRYFAYNDNIKTNKEHLFTLPLGRSYMSKYPIGSGQVFLASSGLNQKDGNWAKHPILLPLMYKIAFSSTKELPIYYTIYSQNTIEISKIFNTKNTNLTIENNDFQIVPEINQQNGKTTLYIADQIKQQGWYPVTDKDSTYAVASFNNNRLESDMTVFDENSILQLTGKNNVRFSNVELENINSVTSLKNNALELWKLCLILSLIFLLTEILLIRYFKTNKKSQKNESYYQGN